jgi:hypothetical protein
MANRATWSGAAFRERRGHREARGSPWLALLAAKISPLRGASVQGAPVKQRQAGTRPADAARIEHLLR